MDLTTLALACRQHNQCVGMVRRRCSCLSCHRCGLVHMLPASKKGPSLSAGHMAGWQHCLSDCAKNLWSPAECSLESCPFGAWIVTSQQRAMSQPKPVLLDAQN